MRFVTLEKYLKNLSHQTEARTRIWLDPDGHALGSYFKSTMTSVFQPIRALALDPGSGALTAASIGVEAFVRSFSRSDPGLSLWKLLDHAASDDESVELDRLCRMLHAINFFRQPEAQQTESTDPAAQSALFLSVHARLLAAVGGNHGYAFRRILDALELPHQRIVLQLPTVTATQRWVLDAVAENYRRNGFRLAINVINAGQALLLLEQVRPDVVKIDGREITDLVVLQRLLAQCARLGIRLVMKRVESPKVVDLLQSLVAQSGHTIHVQGFHWDMPNASLDLAAPGIVLPTLAAQARQAA
jgi:EAL domain-containing protein (putative c-di-GMP-specific phosphodiesterase class I)